jgi:hypothetical protein
MTVLSTYYTPQVVDTPGYAFSPSGLYFAPPDADYAGYLDHIRALPLISAPEVMVVVVFVVVDSGMHSHLLGLSARSSNHRTKQAKRLTHVVVVVVVGRCIRS